MAFFLRTHARRVAAVATLAGAGVLAFQQRTAPAVALCSPAVAPAAPATPSSRPTPSQTEALLIRRAITAKQSNGNKEEHAAGLHKKPFIIGVTGGTASGKTTVCDELQLQLGPGRVALLQMDRFYRTLPPGKAASKHNFDEPDAFDWPLFIDTLQKLSTGQAVQVPRYSFDTHQRLEQLDTFEGADVILVEGILTLHDPRIREQFDLKRDIIERGRKVDGIIAQYLHTVKPAHERFIGPSDRYADIIIPWHDGPNNDIAIEILVQHINTEVYKRGLAPEENAATATAAAEAKAKAEEKGAQERAAKRRNL